MKKKTDFSLITESEILEIQNLISKIPRQIFNWKNSLEIYQELT